jgi:hypothetical protein
VFVVLVLCSWICGAFFQPQQDQKVAMWNELELTQVGLWLSTSNSICLQAQLPLESL